MKALSCYTRKIIQQIDFILEATSSSPLGDIHCKLTQMPAPAKFNDFQECKTECTEQCFCWHSLKYMTQYKYNFLSIQLSFFKIDLSQPDYGQNESYMWQVQDGRTAKNADVLQISISATRNKMAIFNFDFNFYNAQQVLSEHPVFFTAKILLEHDYFFCSMNSPVL